MQRLKQGFLRLPALKKMLLLSSGLLMVSTIMPWYDLRNSFGIGETYLGVQGPLFLIGLLILGSGAVSFFNLFFPLLGRNFFELRRKTGLTSLILGFQSLLFLAVGNSVFYHPEFGVAGASKNTRFGMFLAFTGIGLMMISGWMAHRREKNESFEETEEVFTNPTLEPTRMTSVSPAASSVQADPLTLDPKTRWKMMRSQTRYSQAAKNNLWGGGGASAFSRLNSVEEQIRGDDGEESEGTHLQLNL